MGKFAIPDEAQPYTDALRGIIHPGLFSWMPNPGCPLLGLPRAIDGPLDHAEVVRRRSGFEEMLVAIIEEMEGNARCIARMLFALGEWQHRPLRERQEAVGKLYGGTHGTWENFRKEPLDRMLLGLFIALEEATYMEDANNKVQADVVAPLGYRVMLYDSFYDLASGENLQRRVIRAVREGVSYWEMAGYTMGRPEESVTLIGPGSLQRHSEGPIQMKNPGTAFMLRVDLPHQLRVGEDFDFTLVRRQDPDLVRSTTPGWISERHLAPRHTVHTAKIAVRFPPQLAPKTAWKFDDRAPWLVPGRPTSADSLHVEKGGMVQWIWKDPALGRACGLAWEW